MTSSGSDVEAGAAFQDQGCQAVEEVMPVVIGAGDLTAVDAADDEVVEGTRVVEARAARHTGGGSPDAVYMSSSYDAGRVFPSTRSTRPYVPLSPSWLRQGPTAAQPAGKAAPDASQRTSIGSGRGLVCAACGHRITSERERISVLDSHEHRFFNPAGFLFHLGCFRNAPGCFAVGQPTTQFTWFPGFAWCHAMCDGCGQHLGWRFSDREASSFFALVLNRLVEAEER